MKEPLVFNGVSKTNTSIGFALIIDNIIHTYRISTINNIISVDALPIKYLIKLSPKYLKYI